MGWARWKRGGLAGRDRQIFRTVVLGPPGGLGIRRPTSACANATPTRAARASPAPHFN